MKEQSCAREEFRDVHQGSSSMVQLNMEQQATNINYTLPVQEARENKEEVRGTYSHGVSNQVKRFHDRHYGLDRIYFTPRSFALMGN